MTRRLLAIVVAVAHWAPTAFAQVTPAPDPYATQPAATDPYGTTAGTPSSTGSIPSGQPAITPHTPMQPLPSPLSRQGSAIGGGMAASSGMLGQPAYGATIPSGTSVTPGTYTTTTSPPGSVPPGMGSGCTPSTSPDQTVLALKDRATGQEQRHVGMGRDRIIQTATSPDGAWAVVTIKARGRAEYSAMVVDLTRCQPATTYDIPEPPQAVTFAAASVNLAFHSGSQDFALGVP